MLTPNQVRARNTISTHTIAYGSLLNMVERADTAIEQCDSGIALANKRIDGVYAAIDAGAISSDLAQRRYDDYTKRIGQLQQRRVDLINAKGQL